MKNAINHQAINSEVQTAQEKNLKVTLYGKHKFEEKLAKAPELKYVWLTEIDKKSRTTVHIYHAQGSDIADAFRIIGRPMSAEEKEIYWVDAKSRQRIYEIVDCNGEVIDRHLNVHSASRELKNIVLNGLDD